MWKKLLIAGIALVGLFSMAYLYTNITILGTLKANGTTTYNAGGNVTGRVNQAPSNLAVKIGRAHV